MASVVISDRKHSTKSVKHYAYAIFNIKEKTRKVEIKETLPFRIKFTNLGITSNYGPNNAAPIGIAVIGLNNYVM